MKNGKIDVVIADDHQMFRQGIKTILESEHFDVVGEAADGQDAMRLVRKFSPSLALLDFRMPQLNGIDAAHEIQRLSPHTKVILLTMHDDEQFALDALKSGVRGYILKSQAANELIYAVSEVLKGAVYLSPGISEGVVNALLSKKDTPDEILTCREKQVLQLIAEGRTTKDIADLLHLSVKTAESHRSHIMQRLDIHNVAGLVRYAIRQGLIDA
ncbi:DNA-binding NarL/FixJ family response regulator [Litorivivens lipolytica]|uniref:DNA-binding NarL/FixJ family response regulator n=1 Tax=Litorivivens lipolytica TaxID=1524264 RepID=A0A7W4W5I3_9GAMM|nr:response regulator transcription factor [Litorivivens lipolytica]MBB3047843.1 DNA-binding NarL/FixJ family response regulator [Litorivivens lipolytica]